MGASGRAMLRALVDGTTDPAVLADLARGKLRKKLPELRRALRWLSKADVDVVVVTPEDIERYKRIFGYTSAWREECRY